MRRQCLKAGGREGLARILIPPGEPAFEIINKLAENGVNSFVEIGPGNVLSRLLKRTLPKGSAFKSFQIDSPEKLHKVLAELNS